jgi:PKD repeat protein
MKINALFLLFITLLSSQFGFSQALQFDQTNARDGETVEYCHQHKKNNILQQNPAFLQSLQQDELIRQHEAASATVTPKGVVYQIPIVFHVLHSNGVENISNAQIQNALQILNRDYRKLNTDANNVHAEFQGMPADVEVEFVLATKAPNGTCFSGITRTFSPMSYMGDDGDAQVDAIVNGNDVFNGQWPGNKYLNVFVCGEIGGAAGYTYKPNGWIGSSMKNGIWILHNYTGSIGTSSIGTSRTLTHEAGHWLNLDHTWGGNNNPGNASSCSTDDNVQDTPNCIGVTACNQNSNTCNSDDAYWGFPIRDNIENYMDYSYCSKMFTEGQVTRMRAALNSTIGGRSNLWKNANLTSTGTDGSASLCKANFTSDKTTICSGDQIQFTDISYNAVTSWTWSFPSGSPSTSTLQNPVVTYSSPGLYAVTLTANDGSTTATETKTSYIRVLDASETLPFFEGFETYTTLTNLPNWEISNENNDNTFELTTTASHSGTKSVVLRNYGQPGNTVDELIAAPVDLSGVTAATGVTLSFRYAYRKLLSTDTEFLKVLVSTDCGDNWVVRRTIGGSSLSPLTASQSWTPASIDDWTTVHMTNIGTNSWSENFRYKFRFEGKDGNNIFLDDINIYLGSPSNEIILSVDELEDIREINLYPNPTEGEVTLSFSLEQAQTAQIDITDVYGKTAQMNAIQANSGSNLVFLNTSNLSSGVYFVHVKVGSSKKVMQLLVK